LHELRGDCTTHAERVAQHAQMHASAAPATVVTRSLPTDLCLLLLLQFGGDALSYDWGKLQANGNIKRIDAPKSLEP
jgi:hypothetical protein